MFDGYRAIEPDGRAGIGSEWDEYDEDDQAVADALGLDVGAVRAAAAGSAAVPARGPSTASAGPDRARRERPAPQRRSRPAPAATPASPARPGSSSEQPAESLIRARPEEPRLGSSSEQPAESLIRARPEEPRWGSAAVSEVEPARLAAPITEAPAASVIGSPGLSMRVVFALGLAAGVLAALLLTYLLA